MNARTIKEVRVLLPSFLASVGVPLATSVVWRGDFALSGVIFVFTICCTVMGASCFGNEFHYQTMPLLLAQPVSRQKIWFEKMQLLGVAALVAFLALLICFFTLTDWVAFGDFELPNGPDWKFILGVAVVPLAVFCTTPICALSSRSTFMGTMVAFFFPMSILVGITAVGALIEWMFSLNFENLFIQHPYWNRAVPLLEIAGVLVYCGVLYRLGYKLFLRLESVDSQTQPLEVALPKRWEAFLARPLSRLVPGYSGPFSSLLRKELRLQKACYLIAGTSCAWDFIEALVWKLHPSDAHFPFLALNLMTCVLIMPLVATGISTADERSLGVTTWQFVLPTSRKKQWVAKMLALFITVGLLGVVLPVLMWEIGRSVFGLPINAPHFGDDPAAWLFWVCFYVLLLQIGIFASAISSSAMRAALLTLGLIAGGGSALGLFVRWIDANSNFYQPLVEHFTRPENLGEIVGPVVLVLFLLCVFFHRMAYSNYRIGEPSLRRKWVHSTVVLGSIGLSPVLMLLLLWLLILARLI